MLCLIAFTVVDFKQAWTNHMFKDKARNKFHLDTTVSCDLLLCECSRGCLGSHAPSSFCSGKDHWLFLAFTINWSLPWHLAWKSYVCTFPISQDSKNWKKIKYLANHGYELEEAWGSFSLHLNQDYKWSGCGSTLLPVKTLWTGSSVSMAFKMWFAFFHLFYVFVPTCLIF